MARCANSSRLSSNVIHVGTIRRGRNRKCNAKCIARFFVGLALDGSEWVRWRFTWGMMALISFFTFLSGEWNLTSWRNSRTRTPRRQRTYRVLMVSTLQPPIYGLYFLNFDNWKGVKGNVPLLTSPLPGKIPQIVLWLQLYYAESLRCTNREISVP